MKPNDKAIEAALNTFHIVSREVITDILTAAYDSQFPPSEDYTGLIARLKSLACELASVNDAIGEKFVEINEAADAIEALLAERDALKAELAARKEWPQARAEMLEELAKVRAERDALLARLAPVDDEELVEIGAKAMARPPFYQWEEMSDTDRQRTKMACRAAIAAIRPHIEAAERERCAKIAETPELWVTDKPSRGCDDIAAAIRSGK